MLPILEDKISELIELLDTVTEYDLLRAAAGEWLEMHKTELSKFKLDGVEMVIAIEKANIEGAKDLMEQIKPSRLSKLRDRFRCKSSN